MGAVASKERKYSKSSAVYNLMESGELMKRFFNDARVYIPTTPRNITQIHSRTYCVPRSGPCKE